MEAQAQMEVAHRDIQEDRSKEPMEEVTEEQFLKNLYLFMKKRDTPIERIPNLGFKQIDLFLMFKVVKELGGYHQVTAQQLWKQVYNTLGGNPRSTSAATCTRRHYEKLLLPYECHLSGVLVNVLVPRNQAKHLHYASYSKQPDVGQRAAKRRLLCTPLQQNFQSDPHKSVFPLPAHFPLYYPPSHAVLPPHVPISPSVLTPHASPAPKPWFPFPSSDRYLSDRVKEPLEQLRYLAEQYKTTSGLSEPLNLSVKASRRETSSNPVSSFTTPSSSKNPKFLNKPSPLYTPLRPQVPRNDGCEGQDGEGETPFALKATEPYVVDVEAVAASSSPTYDSASAATLRADGGAFTAPQKASSPITDLTMGPKEDREGSPDVTEVSLSHVLPGLPRDNGGKMEIEVPLSVFHSWLRLCGSSAVMRGAEQLPPPGGEEPSDKRHCFDTDALPTNLTFHTNAQRRSPEAEDLRLTQRNLTSPMPTTPTGYNHQNHCSTYKLLPSGGILKNAASRDVYPFDQRDINKSHGAKPAAWWGAYDRDAQAPPVRASSGGNPRTAQPDFAGSLCYSDGAVPAGREKSDTGSSAVLMLNSVPTSLLQLTNEEVMKLKKIISSSS